jgi:TonB-dependent Receptor Plug Domain
MVRKSPYLLLFFCCLLFSASLFAQKTATVFGKITDQEKEAIEGVSISVLGLSQPATITSNTGQYNYQVPADKEITLVFYSINHVQEMLKLTLIPDEKREVNKAMVFKNNMAAVEVTDKNRFQEITRLDPINVTKIPTVSQDFNAILFTLPGVSNRNELSSAYSVRGGNFDENLVYVNGIEIYRPFLIRSGQQEGLSFVNPDMVSSVLFSAGGFEAKYGDKLSSVLDVTYKRPRQFSSTVSGSFLGSNLHLEGSSKDKRFTWLIGARYKSNRYILQKTDTRGNYRPLFVDVQSYFTYDLTTNWTLDLLGYYASNKYGIVPQNRETDFGTVNQAYRLKIYFDGQEVDKFQTSLGALSTNYKSDNEKLSLRFIASAFKSKESEAFDIQGQYYIDELETDFGKPNFGDVVANRGIGTFLNHARTNLDATVLSVENKSSYTQANKQLLWGVKYSREMISDKLSEWNYVDSAGYNIPSTVPYYPANTIELQNVVKQKISISSNRVAGYVQGLLSKDLKDTSTLSLTLGLRANYWDLNRQALVGPRGTIGYKPNWKRDFLFKFSSGYYYQPPFYRELRNPQGIINYDLKAQTSIHFVLSSDYNFKAWNRPFKFVVEAYYKYLKNIIPYSVDNVRIRYSAKNNAVGYSQGIDMYNSEGQKIVPGFTNNNVAVDSARFEPGYIPRPTDQRINVGIFFQDKMPGLPDLKMHLNLLFGSGVPFGAPNSERYQQTLRMPPYRRVDIGFSYQLLKENRKKREKSLGAHLKSIWMSLEVFNLLDTKNTVSYIWVEDVTNRQYAVPNYLTNRQLNLRAIIKF